MSAKELSNLVQSAQHGDIASQIELGNRLLNGEGVEADAGKAIHWFSMAAEAGDPYAANQLGACYDDGLGVRQNDKKAYEWYLKSVRFSGEQISNASGFPALPLRTIHAVACGNVGMCLYRGEGVSRDDQAAVEYLEKAAVEFMPARGFLQEMATNGNEAAAAALARSIKQGNELSATESLMNTKEFPALLQSLKRQGIKFEITISHNTPDHVSIQIRPTSSSSQSPAKTYFYGTKDGRCFVSAAGGAMKEIQ